MIPRRLALLGCALALVASACGERPSLGAPADASPSATQAPDPTEPPTQPPTTPTPTTPPATTLALSTTTTVPRDRTGGMYAIGDSVMLGAEPALEKGIPGLTVDATKDRSFTDGVKVLHKLEQAGKLPANVVVHLGTNGVVTAKQCDDLMDVLAGHRVVLVNLSVPRDWETANNLVLADCANRRGAVLADWKALALANPNVLYGDGYHLRPPEGALVYTGLIDRNI
jgi:hypothetical protein